MEVAIAGLIGSLFTGVLSLAGVIYTSNQNSDKINNAINSQLTTHQAVTDEKIDNLRREVRTLTDSIAVIPELKSQIEILKRDVDELKRRIDRSWVIRCMIF